MLYQQEQIIQAFKIYAVLARQGYVVQDEVRWYLADDTLRGLVDLLAKEVDCALFLAGEVIYLIPLAQASPFHVTNESLRNHHLPGRAVNLDIYLMYVAIIIFFGAFYDSYQTREATRDFLPMADWLTQINQRLITLKADNPETLEAWEQKHEYNWTALIDKWEAMDDIRENVQQTARTISRMSFLISVKKFLEAQNLVEDLGNEELALTEKAKLIIQRYYMEAEYNRDILEFIYRLETAETGKEATTDAIHRPATAD